MEGCPALFQECSVRHESRRNSCDNSFVHLKSLRIGHHPGVVLDVVVGSTEQNTVDRAWDGESLQQTVSTMSTAPTSAMGIPAKATDLLRCNSPSYAAADDAESITQQVTALSISDQTSSHNGPVVCSTEMTQQLAKSPQAYLNQCTLQLLDIQRIQSDIAAEVHKNGSLQEQIFLLQQRMDEKDRIAQKQLLEKQEKMLQMQQKMDEKQEQMLQMQQQALDRLAIIQS
ncbi:hypothetical protein BGZ54_003161, partial [Gamsiella multidivaricata]